MGGRWVAACGLGPLLELLQRVFLWTGDGAAPVDGRDATITPAAAPGPRVG